MASSRRKSRAPRRPARPAATAKRSGSCAPARRATATPPSTLCSGEFPGEIGLDEARHARGEDVAARRGEMDAGELRFVFAGDVIGDALERSGAIQFQAHRL